MYVTVYATAFLLSVFAITVNCSEGEYFWRPWTRGSPPHDAVTVRDYRGASYIVEAYVPNYGNVIGQVFANQYEVNVTVIGTNTTLFTVQKSSSLKVLCTQSLEKLSWYPTNSRTLQNELISAVVHPVLGGVNVKNQLVYIGRYVDINLRIAIVGSIVSDSALHYHNIGRAYVQTYYEILVIGSKCISD